MSKSYQSLYKFGLQETSSIRSSLRSLLYESRKERRDAILSQKRLRLFGSAVGGLGDVSLEEVWKLMLLLFLMSLSSLGKANILVSDVTSDVFAEQINGTISAFGDFNADKLTDVFVIKDDARTVELYLGNKEAPLFTKSSITISVPKNREITSVMPADFNGDSKMDVLITTVTEGTETPVNVSIHFGDLNSFLPGASYLPDLLRDQPLLVDYNADMLPDLFGETSTSDISRYFWSWSPSPEGGFVAVKINGTYDTLAFPHSCAFVDLDSDLTADLFVTTKRNGIYSYEVWYNFDGSLTLNHTYSFNDSKKMDHVGPSHFLDLNGDGNIVHVIAACADSCKSSYLYAYFYDTLSWHDTLTSFKHGSDTWGFVPRSSEPTGMNFWIGDFNLDGYPDIVTVLQKSDGQERRAFLLLNMPCDTCKGLNRIFDVQWDMEPLYRIQNPTIVTFFDLYENGILDVLVVNRSQNAGSSDVHALKNMFSDDACFLKVLVLNGLCTNCINEGKPPYGTNQVGPTIEYDTSRPDGSAQKSRSTQLSQSAHYSLQLPYTVFGLGRTPNFVDNLIVGIPHPKREDIRQHRWTSIIPNSQMIVIPYPNSKPSKWTMKLFVTPSDLLIYTGAALLGTVGFVAGIIGILHWRETVADRKERLQEAHKFHFDAM